MGNVAPKVAHISEHKNNKRVAEQASQAGSDKERFAASLLAFESDVRQINDVDELHAHLCNNTRRFLHFRQSFLLKRRGASNRYTVSALSSVAVLDRSAPFVRWVEKLIDTLVKEHDHEQHAFNMGQYADPQDEDTASYPFPDMLWTPVKDGDKIVSGFLIAREAPWTEADQTLVTRMADLYAHAWRAIKGANTLSRKQIFTRTRALLAGVALVLAGFIPVPVTALAPATVTATDPFVMASPLDSVVREILVDQGAPIKEGDVVALFDDVQLQNEVKIARRQEAISAARFQRASQGAIGSHESKKELAIARAEYDLAIAESAYASDMLAKTKLFAPQDGVAIYSDRRDWVGRPVSAGEAILQIADPLAVRLSIDLPVKDSQVLKVGARVKVFLDSDPLTALEATLTQSSYESRKDKRDILSYTLKARFDESVEQLPRIGVHGTAQVFSDKAPLAYVVFRRPLASLRQLTGW